jgi:hypothetical protein
MDLNMTKNKALKIINPILAILLITQLSSGMFNEYLPYGVFEVVHVWGGYLFATLIVVHLILNWNWVKATYLRRRDRQ